MADWTSHPLDGMAGVCVVEREPELECWQLQAARTRVRVSAREQWDGFPRSTRPAILAWLATSRTGATRQQRCDRIVTEAHQGIRAKLWRQPERRNH
jgi:hypothetical protein